MLLRLLASRRRCPRGAYPPRAFSICHFCPPLRGRRRGGEGRRRTQCNASPTHGEKEEGERTRRREASYCGIIVVTTVAEEERRTPLTHSLPPAAAVSRKPGLDPPTRIFSSQLMRRAATPKNDATRRHLSRTREGFQQLLCRRLVRGTAPSRLPFKPPPLPSTIHSGRGSCSRVASHRRLSVIFRLSEPPTATATW